MSTKGEGKWPEEIWIGRQNASAIDGVLALSEAGLDRSYPAHERERYVPASRLSGAEEKLKRLEEAVRETLCDDVPCARCDHFRDFLDSTQEQPTTGKEGHAYPFYVEARA